MEKLKNRNYCIDFVKGVACILVVFMHCEFPGNLGVFIQTISRFCVPFFFMVSGYFCYYEGKKKSMQKKIKHIAIIAIMSIIIYMVFAVLKMIFTNYSISFSIKGILYFLIFNQPSIIAGQMWFLFALLYDYIIFYFIEKIVKPKNTIYISIRFDYFIYYFGARSTYNRT